MNVGHDEVVVTTLGGSAVEKKVPLPARWLKGFAEVQVAASRMMLRHELTALEARRLLQSLPPGEGGVLSDLAAAEDEVVDAVADDLHGEPEIDASEGDDALVRSGEVEYLVRFGADGPRCTCPWFARHRGDRGPCKHVLAAELARRPARVP
jgi:SWIM zinc finger